MEKIHWEGETHEYTALLTNNEEKILQTVRSILRLRLKVTISKNPILKVNKSLDCENINERRIAVYYTYIKTIFF